MVCEDVEFEVVVQVLHVVGYEFQNECIQLRLTLDGHPLDTERIYTKIDKVAVNANVTWTLTKRDIKRMKAENIPIKVECFRIRSRAHFTPKKEAIGFILIPLRTIPTFLYKNEELSSPRWYKVMAVPGDVPSNIPLLHLNVIIQPVDDCLSLALTRPDGNRAEVEEDDSFAEPNIGDHFELKADIEDSVTAVPTPRAVEELTAMEKPLTPVNSAVQETTSIEPLDRKAKTLLKEDEPLDRKATTPLKEDEADKYVQNLEQWKNDEKDLFLSHLKKVENTFLESMFEEWQRKKQDEEDKLQRKIEQCESLSQKLEYGYAQLKEYGRAGKSAEILQAGLQQELATERTRNEALERELAGEREENKVLRSRVRELEKSAAEGVEANVLLGTSLAKLKQSKDYYKQKWVQLIREVNKLEPRSDA